MDQIPIFFVSGLPRSGSTLLMNLLGQNPKHYVTPTSGLQDLVVMIRDKWAELTSFKAQGIDVMKPRVARLMRGMIEGFFADEFAAGKVAFDKSRNWLSYIEMLQEILGRPVKILVTIRDIRAIVASMEKLYQRNPLVVPRPANYITSLSAEGRAMTLLNEGIVGVAIERFRDALRRPHQSELITVPYNQLCREPQKVLDGIHEALGLPPFKYDPDHVEQITYEDDSYHLNGIPLHNIRSKVEIGDETPWKGILSQGLCDKLVRDYPDIQELAESNE